MANLRLGFRDNNAGQALTRSMNKNADKVSKAMLATAKEAKKEIETRGREDIAGAGNFGSRWTQGLKATVENEGGGDVFVNVTHSVPYFMVFQKGKAIHGDPLLAIPLSFAKDAQGVRARDFPGGLFRVDRKSGGAPLLLSLSDKKPKYFLKDQVTIPKKFHVLEIIRDVSKKLRAIYGQKFHG